MCLLTSYKLCDTKGHVKQVVFYRTVTFNNLLESFAYWHLLPFECLVSVFVTQFSLIKCSVYYSAPEIHTAVHYLVWLILLLFINGDEFSDRIRPYCRQYSKRTVMHCSELHFTTSNGAAYVLPCRVGSALSTVSSELSD